MPASYSAFDSGSLICLDAYCEAVRKRSLLSRCSGEGFFRGDGSGSIISSSEPRMISSLPSFDVMPLNRLFFRARFIRKKVPGASKYHRDDDTDRMFQ